MSYYPNAVADTANDDDLKPLNLTIKVNTLLKYPVVVETPFKASHGFTSLLFCYLSDMSYVFYKVFPIYL